MTFIKYLGLSLMLLAFCQTSWAQIALTPRFHEFGNIRPGSKNPIKIKIINTTNTVLALSHLRSQCDCTLVKIPVNFLKAHQPSWMTVDYDPFTTDRGWKAIDVNFDIQSLETGIKTVPGKSVTFTFTANLLPKSYQDPVSINFGYVATGIRSEGHSELYVDPKAYSHWKPGLVEADKPGYSGKIIALSTPGYYQVSVLSPVDSPAGYYKGNLVVHGMGKKDQTFNYPYALNVGSRWQVDSHDLAVPSADWEKMKDWHPKTQIQLTTHKPFKIMSVGAVPAWLKYDIQKNSDILWSVQWRADGDLFKKAKAEDKIWPDILEIKTDQKLEGTIELKTKPLPEKIKK